MTAPARRRPLFDDRPWREPRAFVVLRYLVVTLLVVQGELALVSGWRAIVQVRRLVVHAPARALTAGDTVAIDVVTSGRTFVDVALVMEQDGRTIPLGTHREPGNRDLAMDPRPRRVALWTTLAPAPLAGLHAGPATLRATAVGRRQWLRLPPPTVHALPVVLAPH